MKIIYSVKSTVSGKNQIADRRYPIVIQYTETGKFKYYLQFSLGQNDNVCSVGYMKHKTFFRMKDKVCWKCVHEEYSHGHTNLSLLNQSLFYDLQCQY